MSFSQLPIFNRHTLIMGEGYRQLAALKFKEAEELFLDVLQNEQVDAREIDEALHVCEYWKPLVQQNNEINRVYQINLYEKFRLYNFEDTPGLQQFKHALLRYITGQLRAAGCFFLNHYKTETISDLLLELGNVKEAEKSVLKEMEMHPDNHQLRYYLAQVQWQIKHKGEAKKNLALALLHDPCHVPFERILYKKLLQLIDDVGAEMAPAFGWVRQVLPLVSLGKTQNLCSESHRIAVDRYRLLLLANKALQNRNNDACYKYRKELKTEAPALYDEYFALLSD